jgi:hypothetical protein
MVSIAGTVAPSLAGKVLEGIFRCLKALYDVPKDAIYSPGELT